MTLILKLESERFEYYEIWENFERTCSKHFEKHVKSIFESFENLLKSYEHLYRVWKPWKKTWTPPQVL